MCAAGEFGAKCSAAAANLMIVNLSCPFLINSMKSRKTKQLNSRISADFQQRLIKKLKIYQKFKCPLGPWHPFGPRQHQQPDEDFASNRTLAF